MIPRSMTIRKTIHLRRVDRSHSDSGRGTESPPVAIGRIPRVSRLMALAIRFDKSVAYGEAANFAELARRGHVTRARMAQIVQLCYLAPELQEAILFTAKVSSMSFDVYGVTC